mgnify:CR=1 FL=1
MGQPAFEVSCRSELDHTRVSRIVRHILTQGVGGNRKGVLDLSSLEFITPSSIVTLSTLLNRSSHGFRRLRIVCPNDSNSLNYLGASGFFEHLPSYVDLEEDFGHRSDRGSWAAETVLPLTELNNPEDVGVISEKIEDRIKKMMGETSNNRWDAVRARISSTAKELCQNVFDHARVDHGWVAAQKYSNASPPYIELAIGDAGCGIRASLEDRFPDFRRQRESTVLRKVINKGLSRREEGGMGYRVLQRAADELDGQFWLRSGRGTVKKQRFRSKIDTSTNDCKWPGTHLMVRLSCM